MAEYLIGQRARGSGLSMPGIVGEAVTRGAAVYLSAVDGLWYLADADVLAELPVVAITKEAESTAGKVVQLVIIGLMGRSDWTWTRGDAIYVSGTPGVLTQTAPANRNPVAVAITSTMIYVNPGSATASSGCGILEGSTAYVGFDSCKEPFVNYFLCDGTADDVQINAALAYVNGLGGGCVYLESGTYTLADSITFPGDDLKLNGCGEGTMLDGDGLATTEHAIVISGRDHAIVADLSIQTQGGGGKTCHCIFIEDGSDTFEIEHVHFVDSDDNGIHIEGTDIALGHIHHCHINGVDGHGIYVNMDGGETMEELHISDNDITGVGGSGIYFDASDGNDNCAIIGNKIATSTAVGIYVDDFTGGQIMGNTCRNSGSHGIQVVGSDEVTVADNSCNANVGHGIFFESNSDEGLIDGNACNDNSVGTTTFDGIHVATACINNTVINNTCLRNLGNGIYVIGVKNQINNNLVVESGLHGIQVAGGDCQINSNLIADNSQDSAGVSHGIHMTGSGDRAIIMGNHIDGFGDSQEDGIQLSNGATEVTMIGNLCQDGMGSGIALEANNDDCTIIGNYLFQNDDYGVEITAASCDGNRVRDNTFNRNVTAPVLNSGTGTIFHTKQYYVARDDDNINQTPGKSITNGQTAYIAVHAPDGMQQMMAFNIYVIPNATQANADWDLATSYGAIGEANNAHSEAEAAATYNVTNLQWFEIDAWGAGMFASMEEEDTGGISVTVGGVGHNLTVVMAEMYYV